MLQEFQLLADLLGDLSGIGLQVFALYVLAKLLTAAAVVYVIQLIVTRVLAYMSGGVTRTEVETLRGEAADLRQRVRNCGLENEAKVLEMRIERDNATAETEKVKHMYKILKEARSSE